jgi:hypothetical protein
MTASRRYRPRARPHRACSRTKAFASTKPNQPAVLRPQEEQRTHRAHPLPRTIPWPPYLAQRSRPDDRRRDVKQLGGERDCLAWLPDENATTPALRCRLSNCDSALNAPRNLKAPIRCRFSHSKKTSAPNSSLTVRDEMTGVLCAWPLMRSAAIATSSNIGRVRVFMGDSRACEIYIIAVQGRVYQPKFQAGRDYSNIGDHRCWWCWQNTLT